MGERTQTVLKWIIVLNLVNMSAALGSALLSFDPAEVFGTISLLEGAGLFLVAGGMDISSSALFGRAREFREGSGRKWTLKDGLKGQSKALKYFAVGAIVFAEALVIVVL